MGVPFSVFEEAAGALAKPAAKLSEEGRTVAQAAAERLWASASGGGDLERITSQAARDIRSVTETAPDIGEPAIRSINESVATSFGGTAGRGGPVFMGEVKGSSGGPVEFRSSMRFEAKLPASTKSVSELLDPALAIKTTDGFPDHLSNGFLPPGVFRINWDEFASKTGFNPDRTSQIGRIEPTIRNLSELGLNRLYFAGSFVTTKANPNDIDALALLPSRNPSLSSRIFHLLGIPHGQKMSYAKSNFGLDLWHGKESEGISNNHLQFFQTNERVSSRIGILAVELKKRAAQ